MARGMLTESQAVKFVDAHRRADSQISLMAISDAVKQVNTLLINENEVGPGRLDEEKKRFDDLISRYRKSHTRNSDSVQNRILDRLVLIKWAERSKNPFAAAYMQGHDDGNINASFHVNKRAAQKAHKKLQAAVGRAAEGRRAIGVNSRAKVERSAGQFRHLTKTNAAYEIAQLVNLDPGTVRRYLSQLFPGDLWK